MHDEGHAREAVQLSLLESSVTALNRSTPRTSKKNQECRIVETFLASRFALRNVWQRSLREVSANLDRCDLQLFPEESFQLRVERLERHL